MSIRHVHNSCHKDGGRPLPTTHAAAPQTAPEMMHTGWTLALVRLASVSSPQWGQCLAHCHIFGASTHASIPLDLKSRHISRRQPWPSQRCPCAAATLHDLTAVHSCPYLPPRTTQSIHIYMGPPAPCPIFLAPQPARLEQNSKNQHKPPQLNFAFWR